MPLKTKRQLQISKIPRKKGRYISKDQAEIEIKAAKVRKDRKSAKLMKIG